MDVPPPSPAIVGRGDRSPWLAIIRSSPFLVGTLQLPSWKPVLTGTMLSGSVSGSASQTSSAPETPKMPVCESTACSSQPPEFAIQQV